jgi:predicted methyltransferase
MTHRWMLAAAAALALVGPAAFTAPAHITAALADPSRPAAEKGRDEGRKASETLEISGVKPGAKVADLIMGGGYFTRLLSAAVGATGEVIAYQPAEFIQFRAAYGDEQKQVAAALPNVKPINMSLGALDLPDGLDLVLTVQNYHDLHLTPFPKDTAAKVNAEIFRSLKPGGVYLIVDHSAVAGAGIETANSIHRIDQAIVRREVEAAGFKLEREGEFLRLPSDTRTVNVFSPAIRGKTDQFVLRFVKPK